MYNLSHFLIAFVQSFHLLHFFLLNRLILSTASLLSSYPSTSHHIFVLLNTLPGLSTDVEHFEQCGANKVLLKPLDIDDFESSMREQCMANIYDTLKLVLSWAFMWLFSSIVDAFVSHRYDVSISVCTQPTPTLIWTMRERVKHSNRHRLTRTCLTTIPNNE